MHIENTDTDDAKINQMKLIGSDSAEISNGENLV